jgi:biopolymer transport protein ExbD
MLCTFVLMANVAFLHEKVALQQNGMVVNLPREGGGEVISLAGNSVTISLLKNAQLQVDGRDISLENIAGTLSADYSVRVATDRDAPAEALLRLEHLLSKIGVRNVVFVVEGQS